MPSKKHDRLRAGLPPLKRVEGRLPQIFDTLYDIKEAERLELIEMSGNPIFRRLLAEHGYDVREWLERISDKSINRGS